MPIYEYECKQCHHVFERFQRFSDAPVTECPECTGTVRKVLQPVGIVFKGSGWYKNDSRPSSSDNGSSKPASSTDTSKDGAAKPAESKPASETAPAASASSGSASSTASSSSS